MRRVLIAAFVAAALIAMPASPALAHVKTYRSTIAITNATPMIISGFVSSNRPECVPGRTVRLSTGGSPAGSTVTGNDGSWQFNGSFGLFVGYTATVDKFVFKKSRRHKHICGADSDFKETS